MTSAVLLITAFLLIILAMLYANHLERIQWQKERKDLYDRIQSSSLSEYKEQTQTLPSYDGVSKDDGDLYELEIEENKR